MADGKSNQRAKDQAMAAYMASHPGAYPDSVTRPWPGNGSDLRKMAVTMGRVPSGGSTFDRGMFGGYLADKLGFRADVMREAAE